MNAMTQATSLPTSPVVTFIPVTDAPTALAFYRDKLGLTLIQDEAPFALVFDVNGIMLRVTPVGEFTPQPFTILGWAVADIESTVGALVAAGVTFNRYPGMNDTHPLAIWQSPSGAQIAWFTDPFGNVLSLTQF